VPLQTGSPNVEVIHLAFKHDFANFVANCELDGRVIEALAKPLIGTNKPLIVTSGSLMVRKLPGDANQDDPAPEDTPLPPVEGHPLRRISEDTALALASKGVRTSVVRLAPTVHGPGDRGFLPMIIAKSREKGFVPVIGEGKNVWPGVHRDDAAVLFRLAVESAPAGSILHAAAEEAVPVISILETIATKLGVETKRIAPEEVSEYGILAMFLTAQNPMSSKKTRELLGWTPKQIGLLEDVKSNTYTADMTPGF
jgi:nucleoside-diphosphate-sugar epimerase